MTKPKSGKPKKIAPEVAAELSARQEKQRHIADDVMPLMREAYKSPLPEMRARPFAPWPLPIIHPELHGLSPEAVLQVASDAIHERDELRQLVALLDPIVRRDLEVLKAQGAPDRQNPGGRPSTLPEGWEAMLKQMRKDHPAWQMKRLDWEASVVFRVPPETVSKARQAAARKAKRKSDA
jgi:hypothetical protein